MTKKICHFLIGLMATVAALAPEAARADDYWYEQPDTTAINSHIGLGVLAYYPMYFEQPYLGWEVYWSLRTSSAKYFNSAFERLNIGMEVNLAFVTFKAQARYLEAGPINLNGGGVVVTVGWQYD
jgi:hypothetical protein